MTRFVFTLILLFSTTSLFSQPRTYSGTATLRNWHPESPQISPGIRSLSMKWMIAPEEKGLTITTYLQWYVDKKVYLQGKPINELEVQEELEQVSLIQVEMETALFTEDSLLADLRLDLGVPPPAGGVWGAEVVHYFSAEELGLVADNLPAPMKLHDFSLGEVAFGGMFEIEDKLALLEEQRRMTELLTNAEEAFEEANYAATIELYEQALETASDKAPIQAKLTEAQYRQLIAKGDDYLKLEAYDQAQTTYEQAGELLPDAQLHQSRLASLKQQQDQLIAYQRLKVQLRAKYRKDSLETHTARDRVLQQAANAYQASAELCLLKQADYQECQLSYYQQKIQYVQEEAKALVYKDAASLALSQVEKDCLTPTCDDIDLREGGETATAQELLAISQRKYQVFQLQGHSEFRVQSRYWLEKAIERDPNLPEAYVFRSTFAPDVISGMAEVQHALQLDAAYPKALQARKELEASFFPELYQKISIGDSVYVQRALDKNLIPFALRFEDRSPAQQAVAYDQLSVLQLLLQTPPNTRSASQVNYESLLHTAAKYDQATVTQWLLEQGADPAATDSQGRTTLAIATEHNAQAVLNILLAGPTARTATAVDAPLTAAVAAGRIPVVQTFLSNGANLETTDEAGDNLLSIALREQHTQLAQLLWEEGANMNHTNTLGQTPLTFAAKTSPDLVTPLLQQGAHIQPALSYLTQHDSETANKLAIQGWEFAFAQNLPALMEAIIPYQPGLALRTYQGRPSIVAALELDQDSIALALLEDDIDWNQPIAGSYVLLHAMQNDAPQVVEKLLKVKQVSLEVRNDKEQSPLHIAVAENQPQVVSLLLKQGHTLAVTDRSGDSPLHVAIKSNHQEVIEILLDEGGTESVANKRGQHPIHLAIKTRNYTLVKLMLEKGIEVGLVGESGMTPLHYAAESEALRIVDALLEKEADKTVLDFFGRTPYKIAKELKNKELAERLKFKRNILKDLKKKITQKEKE